MDSRRGATESATTCCKGTNVSDRLGRIDLAQRTANGSSKGLRILSAADNSTASARSAIALTGYNTSASAIVIQTPMPHVSDNADNCRPFVPWRLTRQY